MGEMITKHLRTSTERMVFAQHLIHDIRALELLLKEERVEDDIVRIGAEQELCLLNREYRPFGVSLK